MLQIRRMGPCIGGEVSGVDVRELDGDSFAPIYRAWLTFGVIVVRGAARC
jgi:alpha-ketoglutarate-dependent taurine dioxygenase